jgi:pimeloyl-ACP methyl ester carboxylesterase
MPPKPVSEKYKSVALTSINNKPLYYWSIGNHSSTRSPIVFVHGLGGTSDYFMPLISTLNLPSYRSLHLYDFEGHGLSPTSLLSKISIDSLAADLAGVFEHAGITSGATLIAHSIGCLIAIQFVASHPGVVSKLILLAPPPAPMHIHDRNNLIGSVHSVRACGMSATAKSEVDWALSKKTQDTNYLAVTATKMMALGQDPEGYAKACMALAEARELDIGSIEAKTLIITGSEDEKSSVEVCEGYEKAIGWRASLKVLGDVGHWHVFEDGEGVAKVVDEFIG